MIIGEKTETTNSVLVAKKSIEQSKEACVSGLQLLREVIGRELTQQLNAWAPSGEVLSVYPFLLNPNRFILDYMECVEVEEGSMHGQYFVSLVVNPLKLKEHGFPENMWRVLEFGNSQVPPFPHLRIALQQARTVISQESRRRKFSV